MSGKRAGGSASANTGRRRAAGCSSRITSPACRVFADAGQFPLRAALDRDFPVAARQPGPPGRESCLRSAGPAAAMTCRGDGAATPPGYVALPRGARGFAGSSPGDIARRVSRPAWAVAAGALVATSGHRIPDQSAGRLAAHGDREQVLPGGEVSALSRWQRQ